MPSQNRDDPLVVSTLRTRILAIQKSDHVIHNVLYSVTKSLFSLYGCYIGYLGKTSPLSKILADLSSDRFFFLHDDFFIIDDDVVDDADAAADDVDDDDHDDDHDDDEVKAKALL